jgi:hypothetical protein
MQFEPKLTSALLGTKQAMPLREIPIADITASHVGDAAHIVDSGGVPDHDAVARLAYHYWQERGCPEGCAEEDWYRAEEDLAAGMETV